MENTVPYGSRRLKIPIFLICVANEAKLMLKNPNHKISTEYAHYIDHPIPHKPLLPYSIILSMHTA